jgi:hypothetical protein
MIEFVIPNGQQNSNALEIADYYYMSLVFPGVWDGGANVAIYGCPTKDGTYLPLYTEGGTAVTVTAAADQIAAITAEFAEAISSQTYIKLRSATAVGAARTIGVIGR